MPAQFIPESTHDWTSTPGAPLDLREAGADVKTPGDGFTYSVATIEVEQTQVMPDYSNVAVENPPQGGIAFNNGSRKQVVLVQCVDGAGTIQWQKYFFGITPLLPKESRRPINVRGISVWTAGDKDPEDTRIAICGESYDDKLPLSQEPTTGFPQPVVTTTPDPTGFIAVYDGAGELLWTHHFFGTPLAGTDNQPDCAITDVSIRVEGEGAEARDVVTYCGISSYGNPAGGNQWLDPILPYQTAAVPDSLGDGNTDFGPHQWDGIVGRISRNHDMPYDPQNPLLTLEREFHSIVGGPDQDGLFGIAEAEGHRFFVVGSAHHLDVTPPPVGYPFRPNPVSAPTFRVGTVLGFDAAPTRLATPGPLELENALPLGSVDGSASHASDVIVQSRFIDPPLFNMVYVVGTTDDPQFLNSIPVTAIPPSDVLRGPTDGFLVTGLDIPPSVATSGTYELQMSGGAFVGGDGVDGLTGAGSWNEHSDHVQACGYSSLQGPFQMQVASFIGAFAPVRLRRQEFGSTNHDDRPTVMGEKNATDGAGGLPYFTDILGDFSAGGGIAADERGRLTVVGSTWGDSGYPVVPAVPAGTSRPYHGAQDAVRTEFDMLPIGVGRTDGTGSTAGGGAAPLPPAGSDGGTTPACLVAQRPFGIRVGEAQPATALRRMLIDFEGDNQAGAFPAIWASRPTELGDVIVAALQFGLPAPTPFLLDSAEIWTLNNPILLSAAWLGGQNYWGFRFDPNQPLPPGPAQFSAQIACLVLQPLSSPACPGQLTTLAGPALFFEY